MASKNIGWAKRISALLCFVSIASISIAGGQSDIHLPPIATPLSVTVAENAWKQVTFSATDPHFMGTYIYAVKSSPPHGQVSVVDGDHVTYTPTHGYVGPDSFTYSATDDNGESDPATVTISVVAASTVVSLPTISAWAAGVLIALLSVVGIGRQRRKF